MRRYLETVAGWFGIGDLSFRLTRGDWRRLWMASFLPLVLLATEALLIYLQEEHGLPYFDPGRPLPGSPWTDLYVIASKLSYYLPTATIAMIVVLAIYPVSRSLGSMAFASLLLCFHAILLFGLLSIVPDVLEGDLFSNSRSGWYTEYWTAITYDLIYISVGYAFLALRGLSAPKRRLVRRRRVTPPAPESA